MDPCGVCCLFMDTFFACSVRACLFLQITAERMPERLPLLVGAYHSCLLLCGCMHYRFSSDVD
jgi:hypothetical protein